MARALQSLQTSDGVQVSLELHRGADPEAAIIICPGFFQSKETPTFRRLARAVAAAGDVIAMDFRGHGRSSGRYTFSARESEDLEAVLDWAGARYSRLGLLGFSLGAAIAINTASRLPGRIHALAAISAPCRFDEIELKWWTPEAVRTGLQGLEPGAGCRPGSLTVRKACPVETIQRLESVPVLLVHGTRDAIVGVGHSRRLFEAAKEPKRLELIAGGGHAEALFRDDPAGFSGLVTRWFAEALSR